MVARGSSNGGSGTWTGRSPRIGSVEARFKLMAITFFGEKEISRHSTLEEAEQRAEEMNEHAERNPRGYVQYVVRRSGGSSSGRSDDRA